MQIYKLSRLALRLLLGNKSLTENLALQFGHCKLHPAELVQVKVSSEAVLRIIEQPS